MIRAVVKWSYIKGTRQAARAKAHINYIQYRDEKDRERGPRTFFNADSNLISGAVIKARLDELEQRGVQIHKLILSPGLNSVEMLEYAREMMDKLSRSKGLDLEWYAVEHGNTNHLHSHVVVMGTDLNGRTVHLAGQDSKQLRLWGNEYLEREHQLERYLDGELKRLVQEPTKALDLEYKRTRGNEDFERLMYGDRTIKLRDPAAERSHMEWETFEKNSENMFTREQGLERRVTYRQYQTESAGRLLDFHERYQEREIKTYWENIANTYPELAADARRELKWLSGLSCEDTRNMSDPDFDKLITGLEPVERDLHLAVRKDLEQLEKEGFVLPKDDRLDEKQQQVLDNVREIFLTAYDGRQRDRVIEPTPLRDEQFLVNPVEHARQFESDPMIDISRSNEHERIKSEEPHNRDERSR